MEFVLASSSINRKKLLERLNIRFGVDHPIGEEVHDDTISTSDLVCRLSEQKISSVWKKYAHQKNICLMGFDSMVSLDGVSIGKAHSVTEAKKMIQSFVGKKHQIISGVCLRGHDGANFFNETFAVAKDVYFRSDIAEEEIDAYLAFDDWRGKCGAYSILGTGIFFVDRIEGSFQNIVGIPIEALGKKLYDITGVRCLDLFVPQ